MEAAQVDTTQNLLEVVLLISDAPGKETNSSRVLWMEGFFLILRVIIYLFFCLSAFPLLRKYFLFDCFSVLTEASLPQRNTLSLSLHRIRLFQGFVVWLFHVSACGLQDLAELG